jgi:pilus assembly protein Flp/PilA
MLKNFATSLMVRFAIMREEGQTLVEYALILALVSIALIAALGALAGGIGKEFETVTKAL